jgi:hypothetical protein
VASGALTMTAPKIRQPDAIFISIPFISDFYLKVM